MELSDKIAAVTKWIQEGRSLADVQRCCVKTGISDLQDVRFLVDDLDIEAKKNRSTRITEVEAERT